MRKELFGLMPGGAEVYLYSLKSEVAEVKIMNKGGIVHSFVAYGTDVVGGFDSLDSYLIDDSHQGGTIGRVANRVGGAEFTMDGAMYMLPDNDNGNCLHGGLGFDTRMWTVTVHTNEKLVMEYFSEDGEEGFPAGLKTEVTFELSGVSGDVKLVDPWDGSVYEIGEGIMNSCGNGLYKFVNLPIKDYPLILTFGDF